MKNESKWRWFIVTAYIINTFHDNMLFDISIKVNYLHKYLNILY